MNYHLAIDIGASSGRHILGHLEGDKIILEEVYRFDNLQISKNGHDCWNLPMLFQAIVTGIKACKEAGKTPSTLSIDTWGVDYVLLDKEGTPVCDTVAYRDSRTKGMKEKLEEILSFDELYGKTGIQYQPFNTIYQLLAHKKEHPEQLEQASHFLMIPEYLNFLLTGKMMNEYTNATTTSLVNAEKKTWDTELLELIGIPSGIFGDLHMPKTPVGDLKPEIAEQVGFSCKVLLAPSHDTASAFLAVPAEHDASVYISSGTWSLLGVENPAPITNKESQDANFSNEGGYDYRFRYLKNIMGLWMIQSIRRELNGVSYVEGKTAAKQTGKQYSFGDLIALAKEASSFLSAVDVDKEVFLSPDSMIEAVKAECAAAGQAVPQTIGEVLQCVYLSLAKKYASAIKNLESLTGKTYTTLHIVGGGCQDTYLNQLTAKETGLTLVAGPVEGTALGNILTQCLQAGEFSSLDEARASIKKSFSITTI